MRVDLLNCWEFNFPVLLCFKPKILASNHRLYGQKVRGVEHNSYFVSGEVTAWQKHITMHWLGIEPRPNRWKRLILTIRPSMPVIEWREICVYILTMNDYTSFCGLVRPAAIHTWLLSSLWLAKPNLRCSLLVLTSVDQLRFTSHTTKFNVKGATPKEITSHHPRLIYISHFQLLFPFSDLSLPLVFTMHRLHLLMHYSRSKQRL